MSVTHDKVGLAWNHTCKGMLGEHTAPLAESDGQEQRLCFNLMLLGVPTQNPVKTLC